MVPEVSRGPHGKLVMVCPKCGEAWSAHFEYVCFHCKRFHTIGPQGEICYKATKAEVEEREFDASERERQSAREGS